MSQGVSTFQLTITRQLTMVTIANLVLMGSLKRYRMRNLSQAQIIWNLPKVQKLILIVLCGAKHTK